MGSPSPPSVKKDFGLKQGRLTLPPYVDGSSPGANYIAAASNTLPLATSTPMQREMLNYKITWTEKVRNVFRLKKKKKGGFSTDPDVVHHPQPFSRAAGAMVHSTPKIFDPSTVSVENLARLSSSDDDIPQSLLEDTLPGKAAAGDHNDIYKQKEKVKKKNVTRKAHQKQASMDEEDGPSNVDSSVTEHDESAGQDNSYITKSPSNLSKSSVRDYSSQQSSSDSSSSEDEGAAGGYRKTSPVTSGGWQEQLISEHKKRKKSIRSMGYESQDKVNIERPLSATNSIEALNQDDDFGHRKKLTHNTSDSVIVDNKRPKIRKQERIKGPHKSRENLGRPTILDVDMMNQQESSIEGEEAVDFNAVPLIARLSTKAAHDKCGVAKNIKRRKATTKRSLFLHHTNEELKYDTSIVDPSAIMQSTKSTELQNAEQTVQYLRQPPQQSSSASIAAKAVERNSTEKNPVGSTEHSPELTRTDNKRKFSMSMLISKQILDSPLKTTVAPSPSPKPQRNKQPNVFEQVKLKPINNSPIKTEQDKITSNTTVVKDKSVVPPIKEKPRRAVAPTQDKAQDVASPVKEHRTNIPKLTPVSLDTDTKMDTREEAVRMPLKETRLPPINENKRTKSRRAKTVAQPVKAIGYMKDAPAWIELAQQKTRRVSEALNSTDKLPQLSPSPAKQKSEGDRFFNNRSSPENIETETNKESGLPADGYVRRRLRTFSQDQKPKAL